MSLFKRKPKQVHCGNCKHFKMTGEGAACLVPNPVEYNGNWFREPEIKIEYLHPMFKNQDLNCKDFESKG